MAKLNSAISFLGTFDKITHVNSRAYGKHLRKARGTHKPATINTVLQEESQNLMASNAPAKLLKDALDPFRQDFPGGMLWQRLISVFRLQYKSTGSYDFRQLNGFEIHKEYPLSRFTNITATSDVQGRSSITVALHYRTPVFKKNKSDKHYRLQIVALFITAKKIIAESRYSAILNITTKPTDTDFTFTLPRYTKQVMWCVKLEICNNQGPYPGTPSKGMQIVQVDDVG